MGAYNNRYDFWAGAIWNGIMDCGLKPQRLIQAIIFMSDVDAPYVQQAFMRRFGKDLYQTVAQSIPHEDWALLLPVWMKATNNVMYDPAMVASELYNAARGSGTDENTFVRYFCSCHPDCFRQMVVIFQKQYGKSLREVL